MKKILLFLFVAVFVAAGCSTKNVEEDKKTETDSMSGENIIEENESETNKDLDVVEDVSGEAIILDESVQFLSYENKAIGYKILIPENWYWQHFMKSEIKAAGGNNLIEDYLVADKSSLRGLGSEYLGQIVLEVSKFDLDKLKEDKKDYNSKEVTVSGVTAMRFETTNEDGKKIIEYHLKKNDMTFRLIYTSNESAGNEAIFEKMVSSLSFDSL